MPDRGRKHRCGRTGERFTREKRAKNTFPSESVGYVLDRAGIGLSEVDAVAIGRDPKRRLEYFRHRLSPNPLSVFPTSKKEALDALEGSKALVGAFSGIPEYRVDQKLLDLD